jgi:hypothetical protein
MIFLMTHWWQLCFYFAFIPLHKILSRIKKQKVILFNKRFQRPNKVQLLL